MQQDVVFLGKVKNPIEPLLISDLLLLPSETESFGLVALEAMAAGVPVISSNVGGLAEVNAEGETGHLCEVGHVDQMATRALEVLQGDALPKFKARAVSRANDFTIDRILPQYLEVYQGPSPFPRHEQLPHRFTHRHDGPRRPLDGHGLGDHSVLAAAISRIVVRRLDGARSDACVRHGDLPGIRAHVLRHLPRVLVLLCGPGMARGPVAQVRVGGRSTQP